MSITVFSARFYRWHLLGIALTAFAVVLLMQWLPALDFAVSSWFFDSSQHKFVYDGHWLWRGILHDDARDVLKPLQFVLLATLLALAVTPRWRSYRPGAIYTLLTIFLIDAIVAGLKSWTDRACPLHLSQYGGEFIWQPLFSSTVEELNGRCWPGGHALHAFVLLPLYFALLHWRQQRLAKLTLALTIVMGIVFSVTQIIRGQHFLSHQLATLLVCWAVALFGLYALQHYERKRMVKG